MVLVREITDDSPNLPNFSPPNFPPIQYIHIILILTFVKYFLTKYWNTQLMQSLLLWSKLWPPEQIICTSTFGYSMAYKICSAQWLQICQHDRVKFTLSVPWSRNFCIFTSGFHKSLNDQNQRCELCWFSLRRSQVLLL